MVWLPPLIRALPAPEVCTVIAPLLAITDCAPAPSMRALPAPEDCTVIGPLLALSAALASRFGAVTGFAATLGLTIYGLYGVGYLDNMLKLEQNPILQGLWLYSPHYRFADLTQRLLLKSGALPTQAFLEMIVYFGGILAVYAGVSRLCFRTKLSA